MVAQRIQLEGLNSKDDEQERVVKNETLEEKENPFQNDIETNTFTERKTAPQRNFKWETSPNGTIRRPIQFTSLSEYEESR